MSVLNKEEFMSRIQARIGEDDSDDALSFIEDMSDTFADLEAKSSNNDGEMWKQKYEENDKAWKEKYKARFFDAPSTTPADVKHEQKEDVIDDGTQVTFDELFVEREG